MSDAPSRPLTARQARFIDEYMLDCNASAAVVRAGYAGRVAKEAGRRMMRRPGVVAEITRRKAELAAASRVSVDAIMAQLARLAFFNSAQLTDQAGRQIPLKDLPADVAEVVEVEVRDSGVQYRAPNSAARTRALELLGKHLGAFESKATITVQGVVPPDWQALLALPGTLPDAVREVDSDGV